MKWALHVAHIGDTINAYEVFQKCVKRNEHWQDVGGEGKLLKFVSRRSALRM
jgi:hypothetical protein